MGEDVGKDGLADVVKSLEGTTVTWATNAWQTSKILSSGQGVQQRGLIINFRGRGWHTLKASALASGIVENKGCECFGKLLNCVTDFHFVHMAGFR